MKRKVKGILVFLLCFLVILIGIFVHKILVLDSEDSKKSEKNLGSANPALFQACDEDSCIYILGTIHLGDSRLDGLSTNIMKAYETSDILAVEVDINATQSSSSELENYWLEEGDDLSNYLTKEKFEELELFCSKHLLSIDTIRKMKVNYVAEILSMWSYLELGFSSIYGVDQQLLNQAYLDQKEIIELETYEFQLELMMGFSSEYYISEIEDILKHFHLQKGYTKLMYNSYVVGNLWLLSDFVSVRESDDPLENEYNQKMIIDRNRNMSEQAEAFLMENKNALIAVGAAHVLGKYGIVETLRKKGYTVVLVK